VSPAHQCLCTSTNLEILPESTLSPRPCSIWDDGTANPETALDSFDLVTPNHALGWLLGGLGFFAVVGGVMTAMRPEERTPWVPKQVIVPPEVGPSAAH
jgi:hypothetical protein